MWVWVWACLREREGGDTYLVYNGMTQCNVGLSVLCMGVGVGVGALERKGGR